MRDRPGRAGVYLGLQHIDVVRHRGAFGVGVRIEAHGDLERGDGRDPGCELGGVGVAVGPGNIGAADLAGRIAAQGDDMPDARVPIVLDHRVDVGPGGVHAGEVGGGRQGRLIEHAQHRAVRALARRSAGAIGHRHEGGRERFEPPDRLPEALLRFGRARGPEFEGDLQIAMLPAAGPGNGTQGAGGAR